MPDFTAKDRRHTYLRVTDGKLSKPSGRRFADAQQIVQECLEPVAGNHRFPPRLFLLWLTPGFQAAYGSYQRFLDAIREELSHFRFGKVPLIGCSVAACIFDDASHSEGALLCCVASRFLKARACLGESAPRAQGAPWSAKTAVERALTGLGLCELKPADPSRHRFLITFLPGYNEAGESASFKGLETFRELERQTDRRIHIVGGVSSAGLGRGQGWQFANGLARVDSIAVASITTSLACGLGVCHGLQALDSELHVTDVDTDGHRIKAFEEGIPSNLLADLPEPRILASDAGTATGAVIIPRIVGPYAEVQLPVLKGTRLRVMRPDEDLMVKDLEEIESYLNYSLGATSARHSGSFGFACVGRYGQALGQDLAAIPTVRSAPHHPMNMFLGCLLDGEIGIDHRGRSQYRNWSISNLVLADELSPLPRLLLGSQALRRHTRLATTAKTVQEAMNHILDCVRHAGYAGGMISLVLEDQGRFWIVAQAATKGNWQDMVLPGTRREFRGRDVLALAAKQRIKGARVVIDATTDEDCDRDLARDAGVISFYVLPLRNEDEKTIAVLQIDLGDLRDKQTLSPEHESLLHAIGDMAAVAINRATQSEELALARELDGVLQACLECQTAVEAASRFIEAATPLLGADGYVRLLVEGKEGQELDLAGGLGGYYQYASDTRKRVPLSDPESLSAAAVREEKRILVNWKPPLDGPSSADHAEQGLHDARAKVRSYAHFPIRRPQGPKSSTIGVINFSSTQDWFFTQSKLRILEDVARRLYVLLTSARSMEQRNLERSQDQRDLRLFHRYAQRLAEILRSHAGEIVLPAVIDLLLELYQEIIKGDITFYRKLDGEALVFSGRVRWRDGKPRTDVEIPKEILKGEGFSARLLDQIEPDGNVKTQLKPFFKNDTTNSTAEYLRAAPPGRWNEKEQKLLCFKSAVYIPVVVHGKLRGTIIAIVEQANALPTGLELALQRFMNAAELWFELGELHDGRSWAARTLSEIVSLLPLMTGPISDSSFYAALAALLSSHNGLAWNRVLVFQCTDWSRDRAELVYALGGLGNADHRGVQARVRSAVTDLKALVQERINDPIPHGPNEGPVDELYELHVENARKAQEPISVAFGPDAPDGPAMALWLREILRNDAFRELPRQIYLDHDNFPWIKDMNRRYPGLFCAPQSYSFPLVCTFAEKEAPFGIVFLDMCYEATKPLDETLLVTRAVLDVVGDLLAYRYKERYLKGWVGTLSPLWHGFDFKQEWDVLYFHATRFLALAPDGPSSLDRDTMRLLIQLLDRLPWEGSNQTQPNDLPGLLTEMRGRLDRVNRRIQQHYQAQIAVQRRMNLQGGALIPDLGQFLNELAARWARDCSRLTVQGDWQSVADVPLECDPLILEGAIACLFENALAAVGPSPAQVEMTIHARREPSPSTNFEELVVLEVTDSGPGIPDHIVDHIFLEGFTVPVSPQHEDPSRDQHQGRGLALARAQLFSCHGDIRLKDSGPRPDPKDPTRQLGATFVIQFGIPHRATARLDDQVDGRESVNPVWIPKVLVVSDEAPQRSAIVQIARQIEITGDHITEAKNEDDAEVCIGKDVFHLAVVDIMLSFPPNKQEGVRVIRRLHKAHPDCRIIALTTKVSVKEVNEIRVAAYTAGASDFLDTCSNDNWAQVLSDRLVLWKSVVQSQPLKEGSGASVDRVAVQP